VNAFLNKLKSINPELYQMFADAIAPLMNMDIAQDQNSNQPQPELPVSNEAFSPDIPTEEQVQDTPII